MDKKIFDDYLKSRYNNQIEWYDKKSTANKKWYESLQFSLIVLSSLTPVLIAINMLSSNDSLFKWTPIIIAVIVAILASVLKTFNFHENWINYRTICETLKKEFYFYQADVDDYNGLENKEGLFIERVENLISRENTLWINIFREDKKGGK
ncbi:MAG: DUF4231 domain-containing protein [Spirochaetes bacterium]|nr:DUF4231 domain-containing protein [Spirochaetota bacterium]